MSLFDPAAERSRRLDRDLEDFIERTVAATSIEAIERLLKQALEREGYANFALSIGHGAVIEEFVWSCLPDGFTDAYVSSAWHHRDPLLARAARTPRAFSWESVQRDPRLTAPQRMFLEDLRGFGMRDGMMVPLHGPLNRLDMLGIVTRETEVATPERLRRVHGFALQAWLRLGDLASARTQAEPLLSKRELECLKWLREGKSNWEMGQILRISEKTVEFHVGNVMRKLHAESRLAAVMIALRVGLLTL